ncbi:MAG: hypothetical protein AAGB31_11995 [Bdellovibrio sp.]
MIFPMWFHVKIAGEESFHLNLRIPLFLIWVLAFPFAMVTLVFLLVWYVIKFVFTCRFVFPRVVFYSYQLCCALRGMTIDVRNRKQQVFISFK